MPPLICVAFVVLFEALCFTTTLPVISYYAQSLGGGGCWIGLLFALMAAPKVLSNPLWGTLSDRWGRRPVLFVNTVGTLCGSVLWALAPALGAGIAPLVWLAISRATIGAFGGQAGLAMAVAADTSKPERRAAAMGALGAAFSVALALGPLLGALVAARWSHAAVGWLCAGCQILSLTVIAFLLPETRPATQDHASNSFARSPAPQLSGGAGWFGRATARVLALLGVILVATTGMSEMNSTLGLWLEQLFAFDVRKTGQMFAAFGVAAALIQGGAIRPMVRALGERQVAMLGAAIAASGFFCLALLTQFSGAVAGVLLIAAGVSFSSPALSGLLSRSVSEDLQGRLQGVYQGVLGIGRSIGGALGGALFAHSGSLVTFTLAAVLMLLSGVALLPIPEGSGDRSE